MTAMTSTATVANANAVRGSLRDDDDGGDDDYRPPPGGGGGAKKRSGTAATAAVAPTRSRSSLAEAFIALNAKARAKAREEAIIALEAEARTVAKERNEDGKRTRAAAVEEDSKSDATIMAAMKKVRGFNKHAAASTPRPRDTPRPRCPAEAKAHKAAQIAAKAAAARPDDRDPENHSRNRDVDRDHNLWGLAPDGVAIDAPPRDAHALQHAYAPEEDFSDCALPKLELGGDDDAALAAAADADADAEKEEEDPWPPSSPSGGSTRGGTATAAVSAFRPRLSITRDIPIAPTRHHGHGTMAKATHDVIEIVSESSVVSVTRCVNLAREGVVGAGVEVSSYASPSSLHADVAARLHAELKASDANAANANANAADANAADVGAASALGRLVARAVRCRCPDVYRVVVSVRAAPKTTRGDDTDTDTDDGDDDDAGSDAGAGAAGVNVKVRLPVAAPSASRARAARHVEERYAVAVAAENWKVAVDGVAHAVEFLKACETGEGLAALEYECECENQSRGVCGGASASARSASASEEEDDFFDRAAAASWAATAITAQELETFLDHGALSG